MLSKKFTKLCSFAFVLAVVIACDSSQAIDAPPNKRECAAEQFSNLIGKDQGALKKVNLPDPHRIIAPNSAVTMDYSETRVNFMIGETGLIESIKCF